VTQHSSLSPERWSVFSLDQQILMIGNEMNRAGTLMSDAEADRRRRVYERALALTDLTVEVNQKPTLRRELLRWRDLVAELYVSPVASPANHIAAFRCLLRFTREASRQITALGL
jgi:hypothetical protein